MSGLLHTVVAEAPSAVVADVAVPIACVGEGEAAITEQALFQDSRGWVVSPGGQDVRLNLLQ